MDVVLLMTQSERTVFIGERRGGGGWTMEERRVAKEK